MKKLEDIKITISKFAIDYSETIESEALDLYPIIYSFRYFRKCFNNLRKETELSKQSYFNNLTIRRKAYKSDRLKFGLAMYKIGYHKMRDMININTYRNYNIIRGK